MSNQTTLLFGIVDRHEKAPCDMCDKEGPCTVVSCPLGTLDAALCTKCLDRQTKLRVENRRKAAAKEVKPAEARLAEPKVAVAAVPVASGNSVQTK